MPLEAIAPGTRKGNRFYILRGRVDGERREIRTNLPAGTPRKTLVARIAEAERDIRAEAVEAASRRVPRPGESTTFRRAAELHIAAKDLRSVEIKRIDRLCAATSSDPNDTRAFGEYQLSESLHPVVVDIARTMIPKGQPATLNREIIVPVAAILHYAADEAKLCSYVQLKRFKESRPKTRAVDLDTAELLIAAAPDASKRLLLLWLFRQRTRITNTLLELSWDKIDLRRQIITMDIYKTDELGVEKPLHPEVFEALCAIPEENRHGPLFPWRTRFGVYKWLRPLTRGLGVHFTPHMARHTLGTEMNDQGIPINTIGRTLDQRDLRSTHRYSDADVEVVRKALAKAYKRRGQPDAAIANIDPLSVLLSQLIGRPITPADIDAIRATLAPERTTG